MSYLISDLKNDLSRKLHGNSLSKIEDPLGLIYEAGRTVISDIDPIMTKRTTPITNAVYDRVYDYTVPDDLKSDAIIDIRRQVNRISGDNFSQTYNESFDLRKPNNNFTIEVRDAVKFLRLSKSVTTGKTIHAMNGITDNGTWAVGGDATNLTQDTLNKVSGSASLNFDLDGSTTTGNIENTTITAVDLLAHEDQSAIFMWLYLPDPTAFTSCDLRWGSSSTAFWNRTVTTGHATAFQVGRNLLRFDWNGATETGSPDSSAVDYAKVTLVYDGVADTDYRVDNIVSQLGDLFDLIYYSKFLFRNTSGTFIEKPTLDSDIVNLDTDSYNILLSQVALKASQQIQGEDAVFDVTLFREEYDGLVSQYKKEHPSERIKKQDSYYRFPGRGRRSTRSNRSF